MSSRQRGTEENNIQVSGFMHYVSLDRIGAATHKDALTFGGEVQWLGHGYMVTRKTLSVVNSYVNVTLQVEQIPGSGKRARNHKIHRCVPSS